MSITATAAPDFTARPSITAGELREVSEPGVVFEHHGIDDDGAHFWVYTVCGWLNGKGLGSREGGVTIGGDVVIIHAATREEADDMAAMGIQDTIDALNSEAEAYVDAAVALERLRSVGAREVIEQALKPATDKSDAFTEDISKVRPLVGDDIVLSAGVETPE